MTVSNRLFYATFYLSLIFVLIYIYNNDFAAASHITIGPSLLLALLFLCLGHLADAYAWHTLLRNNSLDPGFSRAFVSAGLSVLGKYVPGKIWGVVGRSSYLAATDLALSGQGEIAPRGRYLGLILFYQLAILMLALLLSLIFLPLWWWPQASILLLSLFLLLVVLLLYSGYLHSVSIPVPRSMLSAGRVRLNISSRLVAGLLMMWFCWGLAFCFIGFAVPAANADWFYLAIFPCAAVIGFLAIIVPGGIGVREGVLVFLLVAAGQQADVALDLAVYSRLSVLCAELFFMVSALAVSGWLRCGR